MNRFEEYNAALIDGISLSKLLPGLQVGKQDLSVEQSSVLRGTLSNYKQREH